MGTPALWIGFNVCVVALLAIDLGVFNRRAHIVSVREAALYSGVWVALSLGFNYWILRTHGTAPAVEFFTGYVIENSLSLDNVLVFLLVFRAFGIPPKLQYRVLFWGVFGAFVLRGLLIGAGVTLIQRFAWILYVFGAFLIFAGVRMLMGAQHEFHPRKSRILRWARRLFRIAGSSSAEDRLISAEANDGHLADTLNSHFVVRENGRLAATPLLLALIAVEGADLIFAVDSIPAVFGITRDPFIVYTSNICAILGLRSFYFLIGSALQRLRYLDDGLSAVLIFIGGKMLAEPWIHLPTHVSLAVVGGVLTASIIASLLAPSDMGVSNG